MVGVPPRAMLSWYATLTRSRLASAAPLSDRPPMAARTARAALARSAESGARATLLGASGKHAPSALLPPYINRRQFADFCLGRRHNCG